MLQKKQDKTVIFIIDDNEFNILVLSKLLNDYGYTTRSFTAAKKAVESFTEYRPDLILLDIIMPEMDGYNFINAIKKLDPNSETPIIITSSLSDEKSLEKAFSLGVVDFISRPFLSHELLARVKAHLEFAKTRKKLIATNELLKSLTKELASANKELAQKNIQISDNQKKYVDLLSAVFPPIISKRLLDNEKLIADSYSDTTVLFIDIVGFTSFIADYEPEEIVPFLNKLFSRIDKSAKKYGVEKIKTIGDAYFAICGAPNPISNHCERTALFALEIMSYSSRFYKKYKLNFRIGMHTGPVIGGVIGESKPVFDIWGDTVNVASRMESNAQPGCIQVSECVYEILSPQGFKLEKIGTIQVKGKGEMCTWKLMAKPKNFSLP